MKARFSLQVLVLVFLVALWTAAIAADSEGPTKARADTGALAIPGWGAAIDANGDCKITSTDETKLEVEVPGVAHDLAAELKLWNAPRVLSDVTGDIVAQVKVSGAFRPDAPSTIPGRHPYHGAGLLLWQDKDNYVSLHRAAVRVDNKVRHYINFELRKDGRLAQSFGEMQVPDVDVVLRLERRGGRMYAYATNVDGMGLTAYKPVKAELAGVAKLGIVAVTSSSAPLKVTFENFEVFVKRSSRRAIG